MDFLEDLLDLVERKRRNQAGPYQNRDHHSDEHHDDHDHHQRYSDKTYPQVSMNSPLPGNQQFASDPLVSSPGPICRKCSNQTIKGAKFCHNCGSSTDNNLNCASCGSKLPSNALFCAQCGYKNE